MYPMGFNLFGKENLEAAATLGDKKPPTSGGKVTDFGKKQRAKAAASGKDKRLRKDLGDKTYEGMKKWTKESYSKKGPKK